MEHCRLQPSGQWTHKVVASMGYQSVKRTSIAYLLVLFCPFAVISTLQFN
jgi:hypothetical protein